MEISKTGQVHVDALSPSRITDYFNSSKIRTRGTSKYNKTSNKPSSKTSVYLTPESSPGNDYGLDFTREPDESASNKLVEPDLDYYNTDSPKDITDTVASSECHISSDCIVSFLPHVIANGKSTSADLISTDSCSNNADLVLSCEVQEAGLKNTEEILPNAESLQHEHAKSTVTKGRDPTTLGTSDESVIASPSCPRPKLRKGVKSKTKTNALETQLSEPNKPKPGRRKKKEPEPVQKNVITDFFPVRRSGRVTKSEIEKEKQHQLEQQILSKCEDGLQITEFDNKGRGVVAIKEFHKGDFVIEYAGDLIDTVTAKQREKDYSANPQIGCYMYFFSIGTKQYCVDATTESGRLGRLINHSREGNCCTKVVLLKDRPHLILVASRHIKSGEELSYDYGDRSRAALEAHPWLKS